MSNLKVYFLILFSISFLGAYPQNSIVKISNSNYISYFDTLKGYPKCVEWWVTKNKVNCQFPLKRKDNFQPDPKLKKQTDLQKYYFKSGFDRGHMMPAADNLCQTPEIQEESFYFTNMSAQYHSLNAGDWKSLETYTREKASELDSIHVWAGNFGELKKIGKLSVPEKCWKVIYIKKENTWLSFLFENSTSKPDGYQNNSVPLEQIEKLTGIKFR